MFIERQGLIIWLHSMKHLKVLRKFGNIHYVSRKMKYVVLYCNKEDAERLIEEISKINSVKGVELSHKADLKLSFETKKLQQDFVELETNEFLE